ncbi:MAG: hypothetical protein ACM3PP_10485 [Candidatus Saccharibacteria bacterium]
MFSGDFRLQDVKEMAMQRPGLRMLLAILVVAGVALILLPSGTPEPSTTSAVKTATATTSGNSAQSIENELNQVLQEIDGAGLVTTRVTLASDGEKSYASNDRRETRKTQEKDPDGTTRSITEENIDRELVMANSAAVPVENKSPVIKGVLVVAEGAADPAVAENLAQAVTGLLGIDASRVRVLPMESEGSDLK